MRAGSIVECVGTFEKRYFFPDIILPTRGSTYTVRDIITDNDGDFLLLEEIVNGKRQFSNGYSEPDFHVSGFRELLPPINIEEAIKQEELA